MHIPCILILENVDTSSATTFSNTKLRLATISYFHRLSGSENPCVHPTFLNLKSAARRRLSAITRDHTLTMERLFAHPSIGTHGVPTSVSDFVFTCILALMFDGCLRWDDISSPTYTDVVWGPDSLRLFRTETPRQIANGVGSGLTSLTTTSCLPASACSYACSNSPSTLGPRPPSPFAVDIFNSTTFRCRRIHHSPSIQRCPFSSSSPNGTNSQSTTSRRSCPRLDPVSATTQP